MESQKETNHLAGSISLRNHDATRAAFVHGAAFAGPDQHNRDRQLPN